MKSWQPDRRLNLTQQGFEEVHGNWEMGVGMWPRKSIASYLPVE